MPEWKTKSAILKVVMHADGKTVVSGGADSKLVLKTILAPFLERNESPISFGLQWIFGQ